MARACETSHFVGDERPARRDFGLFSAAQAIGRYARVGDFIVTAPFRDIDITETAAHSDAG
jgi:hypothetical protein